MNTYLAESLHFQPAAETPGVTWLSRFREWAARRREAKSQTRKAGEQLVDDTRICEDFEAPIGNHRTRIPSIVECNPYLVAIKAMSDSWANH